MIKYEEQDFFRTHKTRFHDSVVAQQCLNIHTYSSYLLYIYSVTVQLVMKRSSQVTKKLFGYHIAGILYTFIYTWCSIHKRHVG